MKHIIGNHELRQGEGTEPGDLVVFSNDGERAVGFVMELDEDKQPLVAVLESNFGMPRLLRLAHDKQCMTLGKDWAMSAVDDKAAAPGHFEAGRRAGMLALTKTGWLMNFAVAGLDGFGRFKWVWVDLASYAKVEKTVDRGVAFPSWQLWVDKADAGLPGRRPLLDYTAQVQSAPRSRP